MDNTKKPSILYIITQGEYGGAQHYILDLAKNLSNDFDITVAFGEPNKSHKFKKLLKANKIKYHIINELKREIDYKLDFKALRAIRKLIKATKADIIHLNSSKISILGSLATIWLKTSVVYTAHGWVFNEELPAKKKLFYLLAERFTALFKQKIICVSEFDRQSAIENNIVPKKKLTTIHNGIPDFELLSRDQARHEITQKLDDFSIFLNADFVIGSIGFLYPNKGYDYLINATKQLVAEGQKALLIILGGGPEKDELKNLIEQLKLENHVHILGETENASRLLRAFDVYVCSSLKEGLSYTVIEAMTAGLPIVATNVGGNSELITDQKEGLMIKPANVENLNKAIMTIKNNPELAKKYAESAHKKAITDFEIESMVQKTRYVYETLLAEK
jgi:glycosyltransferase involved in cell wall biosynthesis